MTDKDIIKALECCNKCKCNGCPYKCYGNDLYDMTCIISMSNDALSLINRQKAEIERLREQFRYLDIECERLEKANESISELNEQIEYWHRGYDGLRKELKTARAEAIKEFVERLKADIVEDPENPLNSSFPVVTAQYVDNLVKEMVGDNYG